MAAGVVLLGCVGITHGRARGHSLVHQTESDEMRAHVRDLQISQTRRAKVGSWCAAKHRFDTWQKPFSRLVLTLEAVVATAQEMHEERRNKSVGRNAKAFLNRMDEEMVVSLAMMSDAGDELLQLIRFLDTESHDTARVCVSIKHFLNTCSALFVDRDVLRLPGYTRHAMEVL